MANIYSNEEAFLHDYRRLSKENKNKVGRYLKNLLRIQRAESNVRGKLFSLERLTDEVSAEEKYCNFCGKSQHEVSHLIAAGQENDMVYICKECAIACGEIFDDVENETVISDKQGV